MRCLWSKPSALKTLKTTITLINFQFIQTFTVTLTVKTLKNTIKYLYGEWSRDFMCFRNAGFVLIYFHVYIRLEDDNEYKIPVCPDNKKAKLEEVSPVYGNYNLSSQFYVFVGVIAMLYAILAIAFYVLADPIYHSNTLYPKLVYIYIFITYISVFPNPPTFSNSLS